MLTKKTGIFLSLLSFIAFISATIITYEKIALLHNPKHILSCSLNPLVSCGPIMNSWQASLFGIPNSIIGMVGFAILCFILVTSMIVKLPKWYWLATLIGVTLATIFIIWLITQALFVIGALCIYCMVVWSVTIPLFWFLLSNFLKQYKIKKLYFISDYKILFIVLSYAAIILIILIQFRTFWASLL